MCTRPRCHQGYDGHIYAIVDIADPANPVEVSRWWRKGQWVGGGEGGVPFGTMLHGGAYVVGDARVSALQRRRLRDPRHFGREAAEAGQRSCRSRRRSRASSPCTRRSRCRSGSWWWSIPRPSPRIATSRSGYAGLVDISDETKPRLGSLFPLPAPPPGAPFRNFCERGGRFGPHNQHQHQFQERAAARRRPRVPHLFQCRPAHRRHRRCAAAARGGLLRSAGSGGAARAAAAAGLVPQSEDVVVDARGFIYVTDKNHGVYVLRYRSAA